MRPSTETWPTVQSVVEALGYDFDRFSIEDFQHHIAAVRGRPLEVRYVPLSPELFGFWFPTEYTDYVAINAKLHPAHRVHTLLHELAHILLGHRGMSMEELLGGEIAHKLNIASRKAHLRSALTLGESDNFQEREAESFVMLIQRKLVIAQRLHELYSESTSIVKMQTYVRGMDFKYDQIRHDGCRLGVGGKHEAHPTARSNTATT